MTVFYIPLSATDEDEELEQEIIRYHERQLQEARERLKLLRSEARPVQEPDPPRNGASSSRTA